MNELNVLLTRKFFEQDILYITKRLQKGCKLLIPNSFSEDDLLKLAPNADILLGPVISKKICNSARKLKFIQVPWTGVDNLNFSEIEEIGVTVCNSHSNAYAVAEQAVSLMFDVSKKIAYHDAELRKGNWNRPMADCSNEVSPFSKRVSNSKIGIVGFGHIGKTILQYLSGFNCEFLIVDTSVENNYSENSTVYYPISQIGEMLPLVDFIFICVPLTEKTKGFINTDFFSKLKKSTILINISRGEVIDEDALFLALKNKQIFGAGIDTWYNYPKSANEPTFPSLKNPFHELKNIVMSPHRSALIEGELPHLDDAIVNINRAAQGLKPLNIISTKNKF
ncbi:MAG: 2-hydroxyacid dehydrogenase [Bacteroidales bacterium]